MRRGVRRAQQVAPHAHHFRALRPPSAGWAGVGRRRFGPTPGDAAAADGASGPDQALGAAERLLQADGVLAHRLRRLDQAAIRVGPPIREIPCWMISATSLA